MNKDQWTVAGLLLVLLALEVIRSANVGGYLSNFFSQFGFGKSSSNPSSSSTTSNPAFPQQGGGATQQGVRGFPSPGGGHPY